MPGRLLSAFGKLPATTRILETLGKRECHAGGLWGASPGLLLGVLHRDWQGPILCITADDDESAVLEGDLGCFLPDRLPRPLVLPTELTDVDGRPEPQSRAARIRCLLDAGGQGAFLVLASLQAILQPAVGRRSLRRGEVHLQEGIAADQGELFAKAQAAGLRKVPVVLAPGEVSLRGDVLDIFPLGSTNALRLEFFDGELESIRSFDPASQRSLEQLDKVTFALGEDEAEADVLEHLLAKSLLIVHLEPLRLEERQVQLFSTGDELSKRYTRFAESTNVLPSLRITSLPGHDLDYKVLSAGSAVGSGETDPIGRLRQIRGIRDSLKIVCRTSDERQRLRDIFRKKDVDPKQENVELLVGSLSRGFRVADLETTFLSNVEFLGAKATPRVREPSALPGRALKSFFELGPGDLVVHAVHGIARFSGMERVERGSGPGEERAVEDHLRLMFQNEVALLVPASKIHLVQKYVGAGQASPRLDKLGGKGFARRKEEVSLALFDMAADLLDLQAEREQGKREGYPADALEDEFLLSFPYTDTPDQVGAWAEIRKDLESDQPMDRLLCGDVGFGKTELAMRAAFKVAITGRQVAILVPTTVLAEQHGRTFADRFVPHGLEIAVLSRFRGAKDRREILQRSKAGHVDVLIGTHRLLSDDVGFANLGLLIIDEEQRFGVRHKEHIKQLRRTVDVLTLSATPIPRTLQSSLLGIRDISTLHTAPPGRQDVETRVAFWSPQLARQAIRQEMDREGQVFVIHNRVKTIDRIASLIREIVPDARIEVAHGKMTELQMERSLRKFLHGEVDILVCTTIVENGLDIPRANTMLIERADRFGLAELHQLRGRVGRSSRKAHCYLLLDPTKPPNRDAKQRLKAIEEFANLGAGFQIAMKDLEIRGAGNLLGAEQSGHIAAVGYEMFCQLLQAAVEQVKSAPATETTKAAIPELREVDVDLGLAAFLPDDFLADPKLRLDLLREMDQACDAAAAKAIGNSIRDRYGKLPDPVQNLLQVFFLKHMLLDHAVLGVQRTEADRIVVRHAAGQPLGGAWLQAFGDVRPVESGKTHLMLPKRRGKPYTPVQVLRFLLDALLGKEQMPTILAAWQGKGRGKGRRSRQHS